MIPLMKTTSKAAFCRFLAAVAALVAVVGSAGYVKMAYSAEMEASKDAIKFHGKGLLKENWNLTVAGFRNEAKPGDQLHWTIDFDMEGSGLAKALKRTDQIAIVLAAYRMADAEGHYRDPRAYHFSTYLTPSGLPVEGFPYYISNSHIGGPYKTPLDFFQLVPPNEIKEKNEGVAIHQTIDTKLDADFPAGLYRVEIAIYGYVGKMWFPIQILQASDASIGACDPNFEDLVFQKLLTPPMKVGTIKQPRAIWSLFGNNANLGVSGVLANEDMLQFGMSNRTKLPTKYIVPCRLEQGCGLAIEPDMPTNFTQEIFTDRPLPFAMIEPDPTKGFMQATVTDPMGQVKDFGKIPFTKFKWNGLSTGNGPNVWCPFKRYGKYEINLTGEMYDRFGNKYEAGGTYEAWVAIPLTFSTGVKPGNPMYVGQHYALAATINPPVPADVTATVTFYPATHPQDAVKTVYKGKAQRFGYFYPDPAQKPYVFPEPGEYAVDIFATYTDDEGRVYMGHMKNAAVVMHEKGEMDVRGRPPKSYNRDYELIYPIDGGDTELYGTLLFPTKSGDMLYFHGYGNPNSNVQPSMAVLEPTNYLRDLFRREFPPALIKLTDDPDKASAYGEMSNLFPGCGQPVRYYANNLKTADFLPLMSTTTKGYSPYEYPELVNRRGYFYAATSRPGFPIFFDVSDTTVLDNYWFNERDNYSNTIGASMHGDQPGVVNWSVVTAMFVDPAAKKSFFGQYGSGAVALPRGQPTKFFGPPFEDPVANINGVDLFIYGGVGPSPGTIYETGAVKGVGSIAIPMAEHDVEIVVKRPNGATLECRGKSDFIGDFSCAEGPLVFDQAGVYRVYSKFSKGAATGTCVGARGGWYQVYAVEKDSPHQLLFDYPMMRPVDLQKPFDVSGRIEPPLRNARIYYSLVTPGILLDEGDLDLPRDSRFRFRIYPDQLAAQFPNISEGASPFANFYIESAWQRFVRLLRTNIKTLLTKPGNQVRQLVATIEVVAFAQGEDVQGKPATAGGKFVLRGPRVSIPRQFLEAKPNAGR
jgi:hypothetical protein